MSKRLTYAPEPLSQPAVHILLALGTEAKHGYAIMQDIAAESDGKIRRTRDRGCAPDVYRRALFR